MWVKIEKNHPNDKDTSIGSFHVSPESIKNKIDLFEILNSDIEMMKDKGEIILQGDFNARTGQKNDFIQPDPF